MRFETRTIGVFEVLSVQLVADEVFDAGRLRQETLRLVEKGSRRIVIDLGGVDYLYSDSINAVVALNRRMLESSGRMGILVPHPKVYDILVRAGLENIMRLYRSEAELQSDSRELMRQSSAWTRPAELLSAATASQMITANVLSPKNPGELRDAASASQRIPRRRVGSRVEVKPRRRGGRGLDQEQPAGEFQLPPQLPLLPGESTTLRTLSQDSSAFDQNPLARGTVPPPRSTPPPAPAAEPTVFHIPENSQHDGYSTDAWLLSLTSQQDGPSLTASQMVADTAAGSSSFLPKLSDASGSQGASNQPSQFPSELNWDESEIPLTDSPPPRAAAPEPPRAPAARAPEPAARVQPSAPPAAPVSPHTTSPARPSKASVPPQSHSGPASQIASPASASPFLDSPYASAFLDSPVSETPISTVGPTSTAPVAPPFANPAPVADPWQPAPFQPPRQEPDIRSAIFYDQPTVPTPSSPAAFPPPEQHQVDPTLVLPTVPSHDKIRPVSAPAQSASKTDASAPESWFNGAPSRSKAPKPAPEPKPVAPPKPEPSALDWITPTTGASARPAAPQAPVANPRPAPAPKSEPSALDSWITPSPTASKPAAAPQASARPTAPKPEPSPLDSWITPSPAATKPTAPQAAKPVVPKSERSAVDSWIAESPASVSAKAAPSQNRTDPAIGGTAWIEPARPTRKPVPPPKDPSSFLDIDDLDEQPSSKKPLLIALVALAFVAIVGIVIFFAGGSKKDSSEVPPGTAPIESTSVAPSTPEAAQESAPAPESAIEKPAAPEPAKAKPGKPEPKAKPEPKVKPKANNEKNKTSAKESIKTPLPVSAAPAPAPEEEHAPVKVFVTSRPSGAALSLDGSRVGTTPCEVTIKRQGKLEFNLSGYRKQTKDVDPEETRGTINVQLSSDGGNSGTGRIYISSAPVGAEIVVGGKVVGKTPRLVELPTGSQKVTVRSGVLSKTKSIEIQSGTNTAENFSL